MQPCVCRAVLMLRGGLCLLNSSASDEFMLRADRPSCPNGESRTRLCLCFHPGCPTRVQREGVCSYLVGHLAAAPPALGRIWSGEV